MTFVQRKMELQVAGVSLLLWKIEATKTQNLVILFSFLWQLRDSFRIQGCAITSVCSDIKNSTKYRPLAIFLYSSFQSLRLAVLIFSLVEDPRILGGSCEKTAFTTFIKHIQRQNTFRYCSCDEFYCYIRTFSIFYRRQYGCRGTFFHRFAIASRFPISSINIFSVLLVLPFPLFDTYAAPTSAQDLHPLCYHETAVRDFRVFKWSRNVLEKKAYIAKN